MAMKMLQGLDLVGYMERLRAATVSLLENRKTLGYPSFPKES